MKKFALCLGIVSMLAFVSLGNMNTALANNCHPDLPQVGTGDIDCLDDLIFDQNENGDGNGNVENGHEGDANSLLDGWDIGGDIGGLDGVVGDGHLSLFEWIRMVLGQLIPMP